MCVYDDLSGDKYTRFRLTEFLIFSNKYPIHWYRNIQADIEASNFGSELCSVDIDVYMV